MKKKESEAEKIVRILQAGERQDLLILIIPSHDKKNHGLQDQDMWADAAMELMAELYGGATAFETFSGIYKTTEGEILRDKPILIECYANRGDLEDRGRLEELLKFIRRMGRETRQKAVGLVVNDVFHEIIDFRKL